MENLFIQRIRAALFFMPIFLAGITADNGHASDKAVEPKIEILSTSPKVIIYRHFLSEEECDYMIKMATPHLKRSTVIDNNSSAADVDERRTSYGMFFPYKLKDSIINGIEERISAITSIPKENGENIQVLQYAVGGEYRPHFDYFDPNTPGGKHHLSRGGQRLASFLMYLNTPEAGGETIFPTLDIKVVPRKGDAVVFYNCSTDGCVDARTLHGGAPVVKGEKWLATKWLRLGRFD